MKAVITGAASGIGAAVAQRILADGGSVVGLDVKPAADGVDLIQTDVSDAAAVQASFDEAEQRLGGIDAAVLCAGLAITNGRTPETVDLDTYRLLMSVNVDGVVFGARAATPAIRRSGGGGIVAIASLAGLTPAVGDPFYSMTKHGIVGLTRALGPMLAQEGIRFNAMCPGFVDTPMINPLREAFSSVDFPIIPVATVVDTIIKALGPDGGSGECWMIQPGHEPAPYRFRGVPGAVKDGDVQRVPKRAEEVTL